MTNFIIVVNFKSDAGVKRLVSGIGKIGGSEGIVVDNSKINRGFSKAVNIGIKKALSRGARTIALINPDVQISASSLQKLFDHCQSEPGILSPVLKFRRNDQWIYDFGGKVNLLTGRTEHMETTDYRLRSTEEGIVDFVSGACMFVSAEVFRRIGFFDERFFLYFEDVDFCLRAKNAGYRVQVDPKITVTHNISEHRQSHNFFKIFQVLKSNLIFINIHIAWPFRFVAYFYWFLVSLKAGINFLLT